MGDSKARGTCEMRKHDYLMEDTAEQGKEETVYRRGCTGGPGTNANSQQSPSSGFLGALMPGLFP